MQAIVSLPVGRNLNTIPRLRPFGTNNKFETFSYRTRWFKFTRQLN